MSDEAEKKAETKLDRVKAHHAKMHTAIVKAVEAKLATATMYGLKDAEAALSTCLVALKAGAT